ncbi:MAG: helix-turn-helix domain-containing protein [Pseudonocardia sp.]|nr:helix-turn-helix domain-containing protein [Pseudonocardia sp.]
MPPEPSGEDSLRAVGAELRRLRTERGLSLAALSRQLHYSKGYLSKIETGDKLMTPEVARAADDALGTGGALAALLVAPADTNGQVGRPGAATDGSVCPYPGLVSFGPDEARWFSVVSRSRLSWLLNLISGWPVVGDRWRWWRRQGRGSRRCWPLGWFRR